MHRRNGAFRRSAVFVSLAIQGITAVDALQQWGAQRALFEVSLTFRDLLGNKTAYRPSLIIAQIDPGDSEDHIVHMKDLATP